MNSDDYVFIKVHSQEWNWRNIEKCIPKLKESFEICLVNFKMCGCIEANIKTNSGHSVLNGKKEPVMKCHIRTNKSKKIFTFYYCISTKRMYITNQLNKNGNLQTSEENKLEIESIDQLNKLLIELVLNYSD